MSVPGVDPETTPAAVTVDLQTTAAPQGNVSAMIGAPCFGGSFHVLTHRHGAMTNAVAAIDVGFTIVIP